jgi:hypothetical protein
LNLKSLAIYLIVLPVAVLISITTLSEPVGRLLTPNVFILDPLMAKEYAKIVLLTCFAQFSLLILVAKKQLNAIRSILLGIAAGLLLIVPLAIRELDTILKNVMNQRIYTLLNNEGLNYEISQANKVEVSHKIVKLIVDGREIPIPEDIANKLIRNFPPQIASTKDATKPTN